MCEQHITPQSIVKAAKNLFADTNPDNVKNLDPKHVIVDFSPMHYGMGDKNPLDSVRFYSKHNPHGKSILSAATSDYL